MESECIAAAAPLTMVPCRMVCQWHRKNLPTLCSKMFIYLFGLTRQLCACHYFYIVNLFCFLSLVFQYRDVFHILLDFPKLLPTRQLNDIFYLYVSVCRNNFYNLHLIKVSGIVCNGYRWCSLLSLSHGDRPMNPVMESNTLMCCYCVLVTPFRFRLQCGSRRVDRWYDRSYWTHS